MAANYFLKLDGIVGESTNPQHQGSIDVHSWSWGASNTANTSQSAGSGGGKATYSDLSLIISLDSSSTALFGDLATGTHIANAVLLGVKTSGATQPFLSLTLSGVIVTGLQFSGSSDVPSVSLSLAYRSIQVQYSSSSPSGTVVASTSGWDLALNRPI